MTSRSGNIFLLAIFSVVIFITGAQADEPAWFIEEMKNNEAVLEPGTTTYCNKDFKVENLSQNMAEVQVILGNGSNYSFDQLGPKGVKSYTLTSDYEMSGGWVETRNIHIDEARIINSTGGTSKIKVHCK